jgi:glycerol transport system permease protein
MTDSAVSTRATAGTARRFALPRVNGSAVVMFLYLLFLLLPIYWLINMSLKTNAEIVSGLTLIPRDPTLPTTSPSSPTRLGIWAMSTR